MAYPDGIVTVACSMTPPVDFIGGENLHLKISLIPLARGTNSVVWAETGQELGILIEELERDGDDEAFVFNVPAADQDGFVDSSGSPYKQWAYRLEYQYSKAGAHGSVITKVFQPLVSDADDGIDLGLMPSSNAQGAPIVGTTTTDVGQISGLTALLDTVKTAAVAQAKADILGGANAAHDTLLELQNILATDESATAAILTALDDKVDEDTLTDLLAGKANVGDVGGVVDISEAQKALRTWHVAAATADTTAVDIFFGPGDSILEGAYASKWDRTNFNVTRDKVRRALQPAGIVGGQGYHGWIGPLLLTGMGFLGTTGTYTVSTLIGLGKKAMTLDDGATLILNCPPCSSTDVVFSKTPSSGSFTVGFGSPTAPVTAPISATGTLSRGNRVNVPNPTGAGQFYTITAVGGPVTIEGWFIYNGDEAVGIRTWEGAHSGYTAQMFNADRTWIDSLAAIPNLRLAVLAIGSNDWYAGRTSAQMKTDLLAVIAAMKTKVGHPFSIVLQSYYSREGTAHTLAVEPWANFQAKYREIADADDTVTVVDWAPLFGVQQTTTDTLDGLISSDYLHPTDAGHNRIGGFVADAVIPVGTDGTAPGASNVPDLSKPTSTLQQIAIDAARAGINYAPNNASGTVNYAAFSWGVPGTYPLMDSSAHTTMVGNLAFNVANMPTTGGRPGHFYVDVIQDATAGRAVTFTGFKYLGGSAPVIASAAAAHTLLHFYFDGVNWWVGGPQGAGGGTVTQTDINKAYGGAVTVSIAGLTGALNFTTYTAGFHAFRLSALAGNVSINAASGMPAVVALQSAETFMRFTQDATGGRTLTLTNFKTVRPVALDPTPLSDTLIRFWWDGADWWALPDAAPFGTKVTRFTGTQVSTAYPIPAGAKKLTIRGQGAGGGAGSGRRGAAGFVRCGGGGGGAGGWFEYEVEVADLTALGISTLYATISALGGAGGAAVAADDTNGSNGVAGGYALVGTNSNIALISGSNVLGVGYGGNAGLGGSPTTGLGGVAAFGRFNGGAGGAASGTGGAGTASAGAAGAPSGGGAGGGISAGDVPAAGGNAAALAGALSTALAGGAINTAGAAGPTPPGLNRYGQAGSGGGASITGAGGAGGAGGSGAGGGGGGASLNGNNSGAGGRGGDGWIEIIASE